MGRFGRGEELGVGVFSGGEVLGSGFWSCPSICHYLYLSLCLSRLFSPPLSSSLSSLFLPELFISIPCNP